MTAKRARLEDTAHRGRSGGDPQDCHRETSQPEAAARKAIRLSEGGLYFALLKSEQDTIDLIQQHRRLFFFSSHVPARCRKDGDGLPSPQRVEAFCRDIMVFRDDPRLKGRPLVFYVYQGRVAAVTAVLLGAYLVLEEGFTLSEAAAAFKGSAVPRFVVLEELERRLEEVVRQVVAREGVKVASAHSSERGSPPLFPIEEAGEEEDGGE